MTDVTEPASLDVPGERRAALPRRGLLRGSALAVGALAVAGSTLAAPPAVAADGDDLVLGKENTADSGTRLVIGGDTGSSAPALGLANAGGPALHLDSLPPSWDGQLDVGDLAGSDLGPLVGVDSLGGVTTTYLVTGVDLGNVPTPFSATPTRVIDLRTSSGREAIIRTSSSSALAADGKLRAGQWIDVGIVLTSPDYSLDAVFVNLTAAHATGSGFAALYPPGVRPAVSSINFASGQTIANGLYVGTGSVLGYHTVRLYTSTDSWFLIDLMGGVSHGAVATPIQQIDRVVAGRTALNRRLTKAISQLHR